MKHGPSIPRRSARTKVGATALALRLALLAALGLGCGGGTGTAPTGSGAPPTSDATPAVWRVTPAPGSGPRVGELHLLGSIHVGPKAGWDLPAEIIEIFERSDALFVEIDMEGPSEEQADDLTLKYALLPIGTSLHEVISPELYQELRTRLEETGQTIMAVDQLQPWMVSVALVAGQLEGDGYIAAGGIDVDFMRRARGRKEIVALETSEQQLRMLSGMSMPMQEMMLRDTLLQTGEGKLFLDELMESWRLGDAERLEQLLFRELDTRPEFEPFYETTLFSRNRGMQARLEERLAGGGSGFVVVGAAHFLGERGIVEGLRARGYVVNRLRFEGAQGPP